MKADELLIDDTVTYSGVRNILINFILHPLIKVTRRDNKSLILSAGIHCWILEYSGKLEPAITVTNIRVHKENGLPVPSHKVAVVCKQFVAPVESRVALRYLPP